VSISLYEYLLTVTFVNETIHTVYRKTCSRRPTASAAG